jgi:hypothetical protein
MQKFKLTNIPSLFAELGHLREVLRNLRLREGRGTGRGTGRRARKRDRDRGRGRGRGKGMRGLMRGHSSNGGERLSNST